MSTIAGSGTSSQSSSHLAAREAVSQALAGLGDRRPSIGLLFISPTHDLVVSATIAKELAPEAAWLTTSTAGEITERGVTHGGISVLLIASDELVAGLTHTRALSEVDTACYQLTRGLEELQLKARQKGLAHATGILFLDGLSPAIEPVIQQLRKSTPFPQHLVGAGAGDELNLRSTRVLVEGRSLGNAAVALHTFGQKPWGIGVEHGLSAVGAKMIATKTTGNVVHTLDGRPALEAFCAYASTQGVALTPGNTQQYLVQHELGVLLFDNLYRVRAPIAAQPDGSLVCAGLVENGATVTIVKAEPGAMREAVVRAAKEAQENLKGARAAGVLMFSCVCRGMALGEAFGGEIDAVKGVFPGVPIAGMLSYGEIARYAGKLNGYHNNTVVVAAIPA